MASLRRVVHSGPERNDGQVAALLTLYDLSEMEQFKRDQIADWLLKKSKEVRKGGPDYARRFRCTFFVGRGW